MPASHFIGVAAASHVAAGVEGGFAMLGHGRRTEVARLRPGDWLAYYAPREGLGHGAEIRAFVAVGTVLAGEPQMREMGIGGAGWYRQMNWRDARPASIYPLLEKLSFVMDLKHWGMYFRKSLFSVGRSDFSLIAGATGTAAEFENASN